MVQFLWMAVTHICAGAEIQKTLFLFQNGLIMIEFIQQVVFIGVLSLLWYLFIINPYQVMYRRWKEGKPLKWQPDDQDDVAV